MFVAQMKYTWQHRNRKHRKQRGDAGQLLQPFDKIIQRLRENPSRRQYRENPI
ncbi:hypothetical protein DsansV1_C02g0021831 [Dioscorea sansibarensis]